MIDINNFDAIKIGLASSKQIRQWSSGEVTKPETINYRTLKPEKDGLFCEKIFGPTKDWECYCGKYKRVRYKGIICERCGVEVTRAKVRRERMGHIDLAAPVSHIWFFKGVPSRIGYILDLAPKELEKVLYFAASIVISVDFEKRDADLVTLEGQVAEAVLQYVSDRDIRAAELRERLERRVNWLREGEIAGFDVEDDFWLEDIAHTRDPENPDAPPVPREISDAERKAIESELRKETDALVRDDERYTEESVERIQEAWTKFKSIKPRDVINDDQLFREMRDRFASAYGFGEYFEGGMGAAAIRQLLEHFDLEAEAVLLRETIQTSRGQRHARALKRLRVCSAFIHSDNRPEWMILEAVPVIPPELRPMVQLDGGRFATSDLNDLYRRVINRNNRLKRLLDLGAPEIIVNNEKRMLQEAVDALFDNGRRGRAVTGPGNRPLKSLSDMLKGKQGRFRQNLLGKRVDYSGRSVIVAGPELRLYQCGLPKLMALELFKPFIMSRLVERKQVQNIKAAKKLVDSMIPEVWDVLEEVIAEHPVLLNRAPTLHRLGIQAFEPVLVEGKAIQLHPLVCTAFNADFDGDQMAVHLPLSVEAQAEARILMLSANNILSPAHGRPITVPSQDMILGLYYLTYCPTIYVRKKGESGNGRAIEVIDLWDSEARKYVIPKGEEARIEGVTDWVADPFKEAPQSAPQPFRSDDELLGALDHRIVTLQDPVEIRQDPLHASGRLVTTAGRVLFNHELRTQLAELVSHDADAHPYPWQNRVFTKRELGEFIEQLVDLYGATPVSMLLDTFKALGFRFASQSGITISKNDVVIPPEKPEILAKYDAEVQRFEDFFAEGLMTAEERHERVIALWDDATDEVASAMQEHLFRLNPIFMMANSGARGSFKQIRQLAGMRGCMANPKGEIIERPIKSNFMEGLSVLEYFISTHGARKGLADTALKTADSGYLTRRLVDVSQDVIVRERDCGTTEGIEATLQHDGRTNPSLLGRVILGPVVDMSTGEIVAELRPDEPNENDEDAVEAYRSVEIESTLLEQLTDLGTRHPHSSITVRSPLKCRSAVGVCTRCYGRNLASGKMCEPGDAVGIIAAQSIGEPGTQLTMRTFHTGGVAGADITQGLPRIVELFEARRPKALAHVAAHDGWLRIEDDETRPGAAIISIEPPVSIEVGRKKEPIREPVAYNVLKRTQIRRDLEEGSWVEAGDLLTDGSAFPSDVLDAQSGIDLGITGTVASVTAGRADKGAKSRTIKVEVAGEDGVQVRYIRVPVDRPAPPIHEGMHVREGVHITGAGWGQGDRATKTEAYLVAQVQEVYRSQGVEINDKHVEVIVRQMLRKVRIEEPGDTNFLPGQLVDKPVLFRENQRVRFAAAEKLGKGKGRGKAKAKKMSTPEVEMQLDAAMAMYVPLILGITKASLATESFLSAASFQETTKVLTDAALEGKIDRLRGLKENVIIGKLIPAATGLPRYRNLEIEPVRRAPALLEFDLDEPFSLGGEEVDDLVGLGSTDGTYSFEPEPIPEPVRESDSE